MREEAQRLKIVRGGPGQWPEQACGREICRSRKPTVHDCVSKRLPLGPLLCSAKRILSTLPHPVSSRSVSSIFPSTSTPRLHKSPHHGCTNLRTTWHVQLNFVMWSLLIFVCPHYGIYIMFPFGHLEF